MYLWLLFWVNDCENFENYRFFFLSQFFKELIVYIFGPNDSGFIELFWH